MNKRNIIISIVTLVLAIASVIFNINYTNSDIEEISKGVETVTNIIEETTSTTEIVEITELDEQTVEVEQQVESDAVVEQENISYNGADTGTGLSLLGECTGLTYYSQADSRWANYLYTATNNSTQTMKSSACGPTSAAMVVSSSKGTILPTTMADLFVEQGFRTKNNGTAWSAYSWVADYFDFNDYAYTSNLNTAINYLNKGYYVIASCGSGLFTYGGHYIVLTGIENNTIKIYDPYLYNGKFNTASRRGKVTVDGTTIYCSIDNFRNYASYKGFWCFSNDSGKNNVTTTTIENITVNPNSVTSVDYNVKVTANTGLRIRSGASVDYDKIGAYAKNTIVNIIAESNGWGKTDKGWIYLYYTTKVKNTSNIAGAVYKTGNYKVTASLLNVRVGPGTQYKAKRYYQLTNNAKSQNKRLGNQYANGYKKDVICTVTKIQGKWGKTSSGWICLDYCRKQ
ncbi:MAG: C39 family peptidase [Clostridia bacterium]|nr:C39 family peptidase [Clostridia bacterium]